MSHAGRKRGSQPQSRRDRRAAERANRAGGRAGRKQSRPAWQSPIALLTGGAIVIGIAVILIASLGRPAAPPPPSGELIPPGATMPASLADGRSLGSAQAPVEMEVWGDFQCPGCGQLVRSIEPSLINQYVVTGYARLVFHDFAFLGQRSGSTWDESVEAAAAARCAADQGLFWQMHDWLYANQNGENEGAFAQDRLRAIAQAAGLDATTYDSCMATGDKQSAVQAETSAGAAAGINSTPTIKLNGTLYKGRVTVADLGAAIASAAGSATPAPIASAPIASTPPASSSPSTP